MVAPNWVSKCVRIWHQCDKCVTMVIFGVTVAQYCVTMALFGVMMAHNFGAKIAHATIAPPFLRCVTMEIPTK
jgi:uncharacterized membrane protein